MNAIRPLCNPPAPPAPAPPAATPTQEAFRLVDELILQLHPALEAQPELGQQLSQASSDAKDVFKNQVIATEHLPKLAEEGQRAVLAALSAGLIAGAMDGLVLLTAGQAAPQPAPAPPAPAPGTPTTSGIQENLEGFLRELAEDLAKAKEDLKGTGAEALQQLSSFSKGVAEAAVDNGGMYADVDHHVIEEYQGYLATAFGVGYGIGAVDAAIVAVAGQEPRN